MDSYIKLCTERCMKAYDLWCLQLFDAHIFSPQTFTSMAMLAPMVAEGEYKLITHDTGDFYSDNTNWFFQVLVSNACFVILNYETDNRLEKLQICRL